MKRQSFTMRRRAFLPGATVGLLAPLTARAQSAQSRTPVVGHLRVGSPGLLGDTDPLLEGLRALGYEDGKSLVIENRWAHGDVTRHPRLVRELIERSPAVIVSPCGDTLLTIREISRTVPVIVICADETNFVGEVASLARPGGYTTGVTFLSPESAGKRIELLREIVPRLSRLAVLYQPDDPLPSHWRELERLQSVFGFTCQRLPAVRPEELEATFDDLTRERAEALFVFPTNLMLAQTARITELARKHRVASVFEFAFQAQAGGLLSYGVSPSDFYGKSIPRYVDKILKGAKPAELPIIQPTRFELAVNLRTARTLGLEVPQSLLLRADRVIE